MLVVMGKDEARLLCTVSLHGIDLLSSISNFSIITHELDLLLGHLIFSRLGETSCLLSVQKEAIV